MQNILQGLFFIRFLFLFLHHEGGRQPSGSFLLHAISV
ncbi:hypothetical protein NBRC111894_1436 [Sporolactobacillus inulinus]|uniref:Uncharacterized protein n=1 Tax=Sporolactobacillus inulinus TaxID=2078 RepID=A0A4Y1Z9Z9_9BACL|nr:hypothetical protein NBRC111894_1436 [Sporolactobacillus inulinus]